MLLTSNLDLSLATLSGAWLTPLSPLKASTRVLFPAWDSPTIPREMSLLKRGVDEDEEAEAIVDVIFAGVLGVTRHDRKLSRSS